MPSKDFVCVLCTKSYEVSIFQLVLHIRIRHVSDIDILGYFREVFKPIQKINNSIVLHVQYSLDTSPIRIDKISKL